MGFLPAKQTPLVCWCLCRLCLVHVCMLSQLSSHLPGFSFLFTSFELVKTIWGTSNKLQLQKRSPEVLFSFHSTICRAASLHVQRPSEAAGSAAAPRRRCQASWCLSFALLAIGFSSAQSLKVNMAKLDVLSFCFIALWGPGEGRHLPSKGCSV